MRPEALDSMSFTGRLALPLLKLAGAMLIPAVMSLQGCQGSSKPAQNRTLAAGTATSTNSNAQGQTQAPAPDDFSLSISTPPNTNSAGVWFVMTADGVLRAAVGERVIESPIPPYVRQMNRQEVDELWRNVEAAGLVQAVETSPPVSNWKTATGERATVYVSAWGQRRTVLLDVNNPGVSGSLVALRKLAWME